VASVWLRFSPSVDPLSDPFFSTCGCVYGWDWVGFVSPVEGSSGVTASRRTVFRARKSNNSSRSKFPPGFSKSALLVLWSGFIHPPVQSFVNQIFSQTFEQPLLSKKKREKQSLYFKSESGVSFVFLSSNDFDPFGDVT